MVKVGLGLGQPKLSYDCSFYVLAFKKTLLSRLHKVISCSCSCWWLWMWTCVSSRSLPSFYSFIKNYRWQDKCNRWTSLVGPIV